MKKKLFCADVLVYAFLVIAALYTLSPLLLALINSFTTNGEILTNVLTLPTQLHTENYVRTWNKMDSVPKVAIREEARANRRSPARIARCRSSPGWCPARSGRAASP